MKRLMHFITCLMILILFAAAGAGGYMVYKKYSPVKEWADSGELFQVNGDQVALILNEELQEEKGVYAEGQTYLPVEWVNEQLNERFYWDSIENILVYALPDSIVYADEETLGSMGSHLLLKKEGQVYLSAGLVANYTDVRMETFDKEDVKRIYINNLWEEETTAVIKKDSSIRVRGGVKSLIAAEALKGSQVKVLDQMDKWSYVRTDSGYLGYIQNKRLSQVQVSVPESSFQAPVYESQSLGERVCLAWHQVTTMAGNDTLDSMLEGTKGINVISPTWFALSDNQGNFKSLASKSYVDNAHSRGLQVWALLDNFSKDVQTEKLLAPTSTRKKLIAGLMDQVERYDIDGINLDFEGIKKEAGPHYVQFIRELSVECRKKGIILSVDNYVPAAYNEFYNRREQGIVADYVIVMGYDEHYAGGEMGSVASLPYVEQGIKNTLQSVPKEKLINGIPLFTRVWTEKDGETTSTAMGIEKAEQWVAENEVDLTWDDQLGQYYGQLVGEESSQYIWMEDSRSIELKIKAVEDSNIAGVACWKLGFEPEELWEVINP